MAELLQQKADRSMQLNDYLARYRHGQALESTNEADESLNPIGTWTIRTRTPTRILVVGEDSDLSNLPNLDRVRAFIVTGNALPNLRDRFRSFVLPQLPNGDKSDRHKRLDAYRSFIHSITTTKSQGQAETTTSSRMDP